MDFLSNNPKNPFCVVFLGSPFNLLYALTGQILLPVGYTSIIVGDVGQHLEEVKVITWKEEETPLILVELEEICCPRRA